MHFDSQRREQQPLLILADLEARHRREREEIQAPDFRAAQVSLCELRTLPFALFEIAVAQVRAGEIGAAEIGLAKDAAAEIAGREIQVGEMREHEIGSVNGRADGGHLAAEGMTEIGTRKIRAEQIAFFHLNREQDRFFESAERQIAFDEAGLAQVAENES